MDFNGMHVICSFGQMKEKSDGSYIRGTLAFKTRRVNKCG